MPRLLQRLIRPAPRTVERDVVGLTFDDGRQIDVQRVRDPRAKRLKLSVDERGARLTLPARASLISGERFLHQHRQWLQLQLDRHADSLDLPALQPFISTHLPLRGQDVPLLWVEAKFLAITGDEHGVQIRWPARASEAMLRRALRRYYETEARNDIGRWLPRYVADLPRTPGRIRLKIMSSQWGSLSPDGSMALDLSLVLGRPSAFEYVLVHELCHLIHANHSPAYWREVERRFPHWQQERAYFHEHGRRLKASLRALLAG